MRQDELLVIDDRPPRQNGVSEVSIVVNRSGVVHHVERQSLGDATRAGPIHLLEQEHRAGTKVLVAAEIVDRSLHVLRKFDVEAANSEPFELLVAGVERRREGGEVTRTIGIVVVVNQRAGRETADAEEQRSAAGSARNETPA
jgi:hypothetical protein